MVAGGGGRDLVRLGVRHSPILTGLLLFICPDDRRNGISAPGIDSVNLTEWDMNSPTAWEGRLQGTTPMQLAPVSLSCEPWRQQDVYNVLFISG